MIEAIGALAIFMVLWMFFNPTHSENYKQVVARDRRQNDSLVEAAILAFFVLAVAFYFSGSVP